LFEEGNGMIARRLAVGYLCLVGLPVVAVLLIVKLGEGIQALPAVEGSWVMEAPAQPLPPGECAAFLRGFAGRTLSVSQSGRFLAASWEHQPKTKMRGLLEGSEFTLSSAGRLRDACEGAPLRIDGLVLGAAGKHTLSASLSVPECAECGQLRLVSLSRGGGSAAILPRGF
jgi:hypothetical protein